MRTTPGGGGTAGSAGTCVLIEPLFLPAGLSPHLGAWAVVLEVLGPGSLFHCGLESL